MVKHKQMVAASASMHAFLKQGNLRIDHTDYALSYLTLAHILAQVLPFTSPAPPGLNVANASDQCTTAADL